MVEAALGRHRVNLLATFVHVEDCPLAEIVWIVLVGGGAANQGIGADGQLVAAFHLHLFILIKGEPREADNDHDDAEVDDVSTIASRIAMGELHHRSEHVLSGVLRDHATAAVELAGYGERYEHRKTDRHQRIEIGNVLPWLKAEGRSPPLRRQHQKDGNRNRADARPQEVALQAFEGGLAPGRERAYVREYKKQQGDGDRYPVIERSSDGDLVALHKFRNFRKPGSPKHGEAQQNEKQIVKQETGFARHQRFELMFANQMRFVLEKEENEHYKTESKKPGEPTADGRLREGVHGADDPATSEKSSENGEPECSEDQP